MLKQDADTSIIALDTAAKIPTAGWLKHPTSTRLTSCSTMQSTNLMNTYYMTDIVSGTGTSAVSNTHKITYPHGAYILEILF